MNYTKMVVGSVLMLMSSILFTGQYITSAILTASRKDYTTNAINEVLFSGGYVLFPLGIIFFIVGIALVLMANKSI